MVLGEEVRVCLYPIEQRAKGWLLAPSRCEGNDSLEQIFGICHIFLYMLLHLILFMARNILSELLFSPMTSPSNDFRRCLHKSPLSYTPLLQVEDILRGVLKNIFLYNIPLRIQNLADLYWIR